MLLGFPLCYKLPVKNKDISLPPGFRGCGAWPVSPMASGPEIRQSMLAETVVELVRSSWQLGIRREDKGLEQQAFFKGMLPVA